MTLSPAAFAAVVVEHTKRAIEPRDARLAALEAQVASLLQRLDAVEQRPIPKWAGIWTQGHTYDEANLATDRGSLWLCIRATSERPGGPDTGWRLIAKGTNYDRQP